MDKKQTIEKAKELKEYSGEDRLILATELMQELEKEKTIKIIATRRTGFGSLYHEGYMYVIWKIEGE